MHLRVLCMLRFPARLAGCMKVTCPARLTSRGTALSQVVSGSVCSVAELVTLPLSCWASPPSPEGCDTAETPDLPGAGPCPAHVCSTSALRTTARVDILPGLGVQSAHCRCCNQTLAEPGMSSLESLKTRGQLLRLLRLAPSLALPCPEPASGAACTLATLDKPWRCFLQHPDMEQCM